MKSLASKKEKVIKYLISSTDDQSIEEYPAGTCNQLKIFGKSVPAATTFYLPLALSSYAEHDTYAILPTVRSVAP